MIVAIASGKGGTGKTTLAVNLARLLAPGVRLLDCDVEEPNAHLFLPAATGAREVVTVPVPEIDPERCDGCGECARFCSFNALAALGDRVLVVPELCHGCGGCRRVCPQRAIRETGRRIGVIQSSTADGIHLVQGRLDVGVATVPPLIHRVRERSGGDGLTIVDAPPGTSCAMVAAVGGADFVVLVTEPTAFGLHDLELAVATVETLDVPCGVVVNRTGHGDGRVERFCRERGLPILLRVPEDRRVAAACSRGELPVDVVAGYADRLRPLARAIAAGLLPAAAEA
jgi:MinD superfamily P-loop ATPase